MYSLFSYPTLLSKARQFRISLVQRGMTTTLYWAAFGYLRPNCFILLARDLSTGAIRCVPADAVRLELWTAPMLRDWRKPRQGLSTEFFQDEIDGVDTCAVVFIRGELAGLIWIYRREHASRLFRLREREAELNYGYVLSPYRGMGLFRDVLVFACVRLQEQGYQTVYAGVHAENAPSLRAFHHAGFRDIGSIWHFLIFRTRVQGHQLLRSLSSGDNTTPSTLWRRRNSPRSS
jgi:RimJ/RimL family protein N-acetyltransferase